MTHSPSKPQDQNSIAALPGQAVQGVCALSILCFFGPVPPGAATSVCADSRSNNMKIISSNPSGGAQ
jgi:hypothetical protein